MPEMPEVQTLVDELNRIDLVGRRISGAAVYWPKTISGMPPAVFIKRITGCVLQAVTRRGKYLVFRLTRGLQLLLHLRMTGRLNWERRGSARSRHEHVILQFDNDFDLRFHDTRKFGRMTLTADPAAVLGKLGPEPLEEGFTLRHFHRMLAGRSRVVKPLLLDQTFIAGLGNIYVDEALWQAGIHPRRISDTLSDREIAALHQAISRVLQKGLENLGTTLGGGEGNFYSVAGRRGRNADALNVFRRTGRPCPRCKTTIERLVVAQRASHVCPVCQPLP